MQQMKELINKFPEVNILVIGDIIVDRYLFGEASKISAEAPIPVVCINSTELRLGGAANVFNNICALGGKATLCGIIGNDDLGVFVVNKLEEMKTNPSGLIKTSKRRTTVKTRVIAHSQQVVRYDIEDLTDLDDGEFVEFSSFLDSNISDYDVIVVSDYIKGVITEESMSKIQSHRKNNGNKPFVVDPKPRRAEMFKGVTIITPNQREAELMTGIQITNNVELNFVGYKLLNELLVDCVLITRGVNGMALFEKGVPLIEIPTEAKKVYDVTGAGDTVVGVLALGIACGLSFYDAAILANKAAGIVVGKVGTETITPVELLESFSDEEI